MSQSATGGACWFIKLLAEASKERTDNIFPIEKSLQCTNQF